MLKELAGICFDDKVYLVALALIETKVKSLPPADRDDLLEVIREFMTADNEEAREAAAMAITEILEPTKASVRKEDLSVSHAPAQWVSYISKRIRDLRIAAGLTQEQLADRSGLTQSHICRLERGEHSPNGLTLSKIAKGLGVPITDLDPTASGIE